MKESSRRSAGVSPVATTATALVAPLSSLDTLQKIVRLLATTALVPCSLPLI